MPIASGDIDFHLSGGAANADPNAALGGIISSTQIVDATLHNLFDLVTGAESAAGDVEYRCLYVKNAHGTLTLKAARVWISAETPSADTSIDIALDGAGVGDGATTGVAGTVADESTPPVGPGFSHPVTEGAALAIGDIPPGEAQAIWLRWTVDPGAAAVASDNAILTVKGDTAA